MAVGSLQRLANKIFNLKSMTPDLHTILFGTVTLPILSAAPYSAGSSSAVLFENVLSMLQEARPVIQGTALRCLACRGIASDGADTSAGTLGTLESQKRCALLTRGLRMRVLVFFVCLCYVDVSLSRALDSS